MAVVIVEFNENQKQAPRMFDYTVNQRLALFSDYKIFHQKGTKCVFWEGKRCEKIQRQQNADPQIIYSVNCLILHGLISYNRGENTTEENGRHGPVSKEEENPQHCLELEHI